MVLSSHRPRAVFSLNLNHLERCDFDLPADPFK